MSYIESLEAAGATVLEEASFGSYQGDWFALVDYKGKRGYVQGSYGSCSGCDAFEAEFNYGEKTCDEHNYNYSDVCEDCIGAKERYNEKLVDFGRGYLEDVDGALGLTDYDETLAYAVRNIEWDSDAQSMVTWVESTKEKYDN